MRAFANKFTVSADETTTRVDFFDVIGDKEQSAGGIAVSHKDAKELVACIVQVQNKLEEAQAKKP